MNLRDVLTQDAKAVWADEIVPICFKWNPGGVTTNLVIGWLVEEVVSLRKVTKQIQKLERVAFEAERHLNLEPHAGRDLRKALAKLKEAQ